MDASKYFAHIPHDQNDPQYSTPCVGQPDPDYDELTDEEKADVAWEKNIDNE